MFLPFEEFKAFSYISYFFFARSTFFQFTFSHPFILGVVLRIEFYALKMAKKFRKIYDFNRVGTFDFIQIREHGERVSNTYSHITFFHYLPFESCNYILSKIYMSARQFPQPGEKFFGCRAFRSKNFYYTLKIVVNKRTRSNHLLAMCRGFTIVKYRSHVFIVRSKSMRRKARLSTEASNTSSVL